MQLIGIALVLGLTAGLARADELAEKVRAVFERAKRQVVLVRFEQPMPDNPFGARGGRGDGGGGGGTRRARVTGFFADATTVVVPTSAIDRGPGGRGRGGPGGGSGGDAGADEADIDETYGWKAVLPDGAEVALQVHRRDADTGFTLLRAKAAAGVASPVTFATGEPGLADPLVVVDLAGEDLGYQPRFTITRINVVHGKERPVFGTTDSVEGYQGGLAYDLKGDLVGVIAPTPRAARPVREEDEGGGGGGGGATARRLGGGGGGGGARVVSGQWVTAALRGRDKEKKPEPGKEEK